MKNLFVTLKNDKEKECSYKISLCTTTHKRSSEKNTGVLYSYANTRWDYIQKDTSYFYYTSNKENENLWICFKSISSSKDIQNDIIDKVLYVVSLYKDKLIKKINSLNDGKNNITITIKEFNTDTTIDKYLKEQLLVDGVYYSSLLTKWYFKDDKLVKCYYTIMADNTVLEVNIKDEYNILNEDFIDNILVDTILEVYKIKKGSICDEI